MAKFGKKYRTSQIKEWKSHYINYKAMKQKIKSIRKKIESKERDNTLNLAEQNSLIPSLNVIPIIKGRASLQLDDLSLLYGRKYGQDLKEFIDLLDSELDKCYLFYIKLENELFKKVNTHLYTQTNYPNYNAYEIYIEMKKLNKTVFLIKCINSFIYNNMNALKYILKKFDSKLSASCGKIQTKYIFHQLTLQENRLENILKYKTIDEALIICESNLKELLKYYNQNQNQNNPNINDKKTNYNFDQNSYNNNNNIDNNKDDEINFENKNNILIKDKNNEEVDLEGLNNNNIREKINTKKEEIFKYMKEIDELTYFKIQYGDWFYYLKEENDKLTKHDQKLLENDIFNPILSASYKNDNIINKFLSKKDGGTELKNAQIPMSLFNKTNICFIIFHTFFYNTLITCIYPLLFLYIKHIEEKKVKHIYSFLIIVLTYLSSFFFMIIYHTTNITNIKKTNMISYVLSFIGSMGYIISIKYLENNDNDYVVFGCILGSRIFIGLGDNIMMGKKYITIYSPRFYVAKISLYFIIFQIMGLAFGPLIGGLLLYIPKINFWYFEYNCYNCIGWYGCICSLFLFVFNCILFTSPDSSDFFILRNGNRNNTFSQSNFGGDIEDTQDKEYNQLQIQLINNKQKNCIENDNIIVNIIDNKNNADDSNDKSSEVEDKRKNISIFKRKTMLRSQKNLTVFNDIGKSVKKIKKRTTSNFNFEDVVIDNKEDYKYIDGNPLLITVQKEMDNIQTQNDDNIIINDFNRINMIPRTIDDIIRKEKLTFGYINCNLLILFLLLFFNNMIKENYIAFFSYYIIEINNFTDDDGKTQDKNDNLNFKKVQFICFATGFVYLSELLSLFFIFPFHKINYSFKKYLIILMTMTNILMISLSILIRYNFYNFYYPYYVIVALLILINMIIEVISSSYLSYLLPPGWTFSNIKAGRLTFYIMIFGKICGCLFCIVSYSDSTWNFFGITIIVFLAYSFISFHLCKSHNLRIKSICRIMQQKKLEEYIL